MYTIKSKDCLGYPTTGNFRWCKFLRKFIRTLQKNFLRFYFCKMKAWCSDHIPHPYQMMSTSHSTYTEETEQRSKASLCNNGLLFLLRGGLYNYESIKTACRRGRKTGLLNGRIQHCWSQTHNFGAFLTGLLVFCLHRLVVGWVSSASTIYWSDIIFAADCREPSPSHRYKFVFHNDVINSLLVHFFTVYIFVEAGLSVKITKISHYTVPHFSL